MLDTCRALHFLDKNSWVSDNQILFGVCPKDKRIGKFFPYFASINLFHNDGVFLYSFIWLYDN